MGEERTYHLIVDRGGWWVVVGVQPCRDWPPVSQVIILEEKGNWKGEGVRLGHGLPHQQQFKVRDICILSQSRLQTEMDSIYPVQYPSSDLFRSSRFEKTESSLPSYIELRFLA